MADRAPFTLRGRNPDVLACIANLSNDEVFTSPDLANRMLDTLAEAWAESNGGKNIWQDSTVRFLDPCTKSGVFLREITRRLTEGLAGEIPDLRQRVDHILRKQVFGIAITKLTSLMARRTLYCSKHVKGEHSIAVNLNSDAGNIWFEQGEHTWEDGKCTYCGASRKTFDRGEGMESHAYMFIHHKNIVTTIKSLFGEDMHFDVIIGNPPYQLDDGGHGASALPIYHKFIDQAKSLNPRLLSMVIPARWLFGGRGLDEFRKNMLTDKRLRTLIDYPDSRDVFQGVDVAGGITYFIWDRDNPGECRVTSFRVPERPNSAVRALLEPGLDVFIRFNESLSILRKIAAIETGGHSLGLPTEKRFDEQVSSQKPFGLRTFFRGRKTRKNQHDVLVLQSGGKSYASRSEILSGSDLIDKWKVFTSKSSSEHAGQVDKSGMRRVLSLSGILPPGSAVTETYVLLGAYNSRREAENCLSYVTTKFFRFLVSARSSAQDLPRAAYSLVPLQDFSRSWSDQDLYKKYGLSEDETHFIESTIKPMTVEADVHDD